MYNVRCVLSSKLLPAVFVYTGRCDEGSVSVAKWMSPMTVHVSPVFSSYNMLIGGSGTTWDLKALGFAAESTGGFYVYARLWCRPLYERAKYWLRNSASHHAFYEHDAPCDSAQHTYHMC